MKDYSKVFLENIVSKAKTVDEEKRNSDGSLEIKISDNDIKSILERKRLRGGLKENLIKDLESANCKATTCDTNSLCVTIPKEKMEKEIMKYSDL